MQPIFKVSDRVFWDKRGWGTIKHISLDPSNKYPIIVEFDNKTDSISFTLAGYYHEDDLVPSLSFTEYEMIRFSQVRPRPDLKEGELIWVRNDGGEWLYKRFYAWTDKGVYVTNQYNMLQYKYTQYSVECPVK